MYKIIVFKCLFLFVFLVGCEYIPTDEDLQLGSNGSRQNDPLSPGYYPTGIRENTDTNRYEKIIENIFIDAEKDHLSTFSIDVDTAAYTNIRSNIKRGIKPHKDAVRIEEMINYFQYQYPEPQNDDPFGLQVTSTTAPWNPENRLVHIGIQGKDIPQQERPPANLVFLIDSSGSMSGQIELLKQGLTLLAGSLNADDKVAIVVYAASEGLVLDSTSDKQKVIDALSSITSGGATNGGSGIQLAYKIAFKNKIAGGINRVILATDGDFNVGVTDDDALVDLVSEKAKEGVDLSVLGFGYGNYNDAMMEKISNSGNGNYSYIDSIAEAKKVLMQQVNGSLYTIARDVKVQVDFNVGLVKEFRLLGYENRVLNHEDFEDDNKDAGEVGSGHTITALYEVVMRHQHDSPEDDVEDIMEDMLTLNIRYKQKINDESKLVQLHVADEVVPLEEASIDTRFCAAVAGFGMVLRGSDFSASLTLEDIIELSTSSIGDDVSGYRQEFTSLLKMYGALNAE